jgi:two-component system, chemotaxis family, response regulator PixG
MISAQSKNTTLSALSLLENAANRKANGFLKVTANGVSWFIYLSDGKIFHANFSVEPIDRIEIYMRQVLKARNQHPEGQMFEKLRQRIANAKLDDFYPSYDYQALYSLVRKKQLPAADAANMIREITKETMRSFLLLSEFTYSFVDDNRQFPILWSINFLSLSKECQDEINDWKALGTRIYSPYQRPFVQKNNEDNGKYDYLQKFLVGVDFNNLALQLNRPAIRVAQSLDPLIAAGVVGLRPPKSQYAKLPKSSDIDGEQDLSFEMITATQYKIVCVDDSPTILQRMNDFLDSSHFQIFSVLDSGAALTKIITIKPHAILMDIDMPHIDGYQLCAMVRRNSTFKDTPIIMVTSNSGFIDRARAKFCGATDYMTKPFTQAALNDMVFKYVVR